MSLIFNLPPLANTKAPNRVHLPKFLYRLAHANSGNYSIYHEGVERKYAHPALDFLDDPQNAITAYAKVESHNFDGDTFRRHLLQRCRKPPYSSLISFSDSAVITEQRVPLWYNNRAIPARLMNIIKISTGGTIPAILTGRERRDLLVWVSESAKPENEQRISLETFLRLDPTPEIWISSSQIYGDKPWGPKWWFRTSYQEDEWLIGHAVPKSRVVEVLPCKGTKIVLNNTAGQGVVTESLNDSEYWWDCKATIWRQTRDYKPPHKVTSADKESHQRPWHKLEEKSGSSGGARAQRKFYKKRGYNPEWKDSQSMTKRSKKTLTQHEQDHGVRGEQDPGHSKKEPVSGNDEEPMSENDEKLVPEKGEELMHQAEKACEKSKDVGASEEKRANSMDVNTDEESSNKAMAMA